VLFSLSVFKEMNSHLILSSLSLLSLVSAQGPPGGGGMEMGGDDTLGQSADTTCPAVTGSCLLDGSSNYAVRELTYDSATGIFSGSIITNSCPNFRYQVIDGNTVATNLNTGEIDATLLAGGAEADCVKQTFPSYTGPTAAPTLGAVAYSLRGVQIYGLFSCIEIRSF
jgi:hypothetical protein